MYRWCEHGDEVNAVVWDPSSRLLASCSDDKLIKIWNPQQSKSVATLTGHEREIYTVRWRPGAGSSERLLRWALSFSSMCLHVSVSGCECLTAWC